MGTVAQLRTDFFINSYKIIAEHASHHSIWIGFSIIFVVVVIVLAISSLHIVCKTYLQWLFLYCSLQVDCCKSKSSLQDGCLVERACKTHNPSRPCCNAFSAACLSLNNFVFLLSHCHYYLLVL